MTSMYVIGSLRNPNIPVVAGKLREIGIDAFDQWYAAGPEADDYWQKYSNQRGQTYAEALRDYAAQHVFEFDLTHLNRCDAALLVLPAGKSGHLELGYARGLGKRTFILFDKVPDRYDVMYNFAEEVFFSDYDMLEYLKQFPNQGDRGNYERFLKNG